MPKTPTVLHFLGYDDDRGGIVSVVRNLAAESRFACVLGLNRGGAQRRDPPLVQHEFPALEGERIDLQNVFRARAAAHAVRAWLQEDPTRILHAHSRAGLLVALWLRWWGEKRIVVSVHCYGRQRWFYRWAARRLGTRLYWLSPAMRQFYGVSGEAWEQCIPGCTPMTDGNVVASSGRKTGIVRLAGVGTRVRWKRWHDVIEALSLLPPATRARLRFTHIGGGDGTRDSSDYARELRARVEEAGVGECVEWRGLEASSASLLAESDALVIASKNEPFAVAMLEALAAGVPVLAADSGGATDLIHPPVNGFLFKTGSPHALTRVLRGIVEEDSLRGVSLDAASLQRFSPGVVAARWAEVYQHLLTLPT